ncbi:MAG: AAA family ATPase [Verrucomicrobiales bacterium]|nr:AAA family ATPase [Verrucomicrobiales bacterium]
MNVRIPTLTIERFRALRQLKLEGLGRVNLITGRNNTGKSSVLEALRILASEATPSVLASILRFREEDLADPEDATRATDQDGFGQFAALFSGYPLISEIREPIVLASEGGERPLRLAISFAWLSEEKDDSGGRKLVPWQPQLFGAEGSIPALNIEGPTGNRVMTLDHFRRFGGRSRFLRAEWTEEPRTPCVFVSPYGGERTATLGTLWDKIALTDNEKDVVQALRIMVGDVEAVSMVGGEGPRQTRTAIVRSGGFKRPVPLRSFGDGLNRLFGIVLSLVNAKEGLLLIDEFENGMHHTIQLDVWRAIFRLSEQLRIQVFATSHSWDAVESFQRAAAEDPAEGLLIRLSRKGDSVMPTLFREDELAVATREHIEVR